MTSNGTERGSVTIEVVLLAPVFALLVIAVIAVGRVQAGRADVEGVAHSAARTITLARDPGAVLEQARREAASAVGEGSRTCRTMGWKVMISWTEATVTISCTIDLADAGLLPLPGSYRVDATAREPFDRFRESR